MIDSLSRLITRRRQDSYCLDPSWGCHPVKSRFRLGFSCLGFVM